MSALLRKRPCNQSGHSISGDRRHMADGEPLGGVFAVDAHSGCSCRDGRTQYLAKMLFPELDRLPHLVRVVEPVVDRSDAANLSTRVIEELFDHVDCNAER